MRKILRKAAPGNAGAAVHRLHFALVIGFLTLALALGGAGTSYPLLELIIELASLPVVFLAIGFVPVPADRWARAALLILMGIILLPLSQLAPLPAGLAERLPGREATQQVFALISYAKAPKAISLDPEATWRALLELMVGGAAFVSVLQLPTARRASLGWLIVAFAVISALIGALQAAGLSSFNLFQTSHAGLATGLFVNRNHQACFLNVAVVLIAGLIGGSPRRTLISYVLAAALICLFVATVIATRSRTGVALLCLTVPLAVMLLRPPLKSMLVCTVAAILAGSAAVYFTSAGQVALDRFSAPDTRITYWADTIAAIRQYWPVGTGFGSFPYVFQAFESLATVDATFVNNAHNDYLELLLEGGAAAGLLFLIAMTFLAWAGLRRVRSAKSRQSSRLAFAALAGVFLVCAHSIVDYPLRMLSIMAVFGCLAALLFEPLANVRDLRSRRHAPLRLGRPAIACIAVALIAYRATFLHLATYAVQTGNVSLAEWVGAGSADVQTWFAQRELEKQGYSASQRAGTYALRVSPVRAGALSSLALAEVAQGETGTATKLMAAAAAMTWRDRPAQAWALSDAIIRDDFRAAAERADALLRLNPNYEQALAALSTLLSTSEGRRAIVDRLTEHPPWAGSFFNAVENRTNLQLQDEAKLLLEMRSSQAAIPPTYISPVLKELVSRGAYSRAYEVWAATRPTRGKSLVFDPEFVLVAGNWPGSGLPFEWTPQFSRDLDLSPAADSPRRGLHVAAGAGTAATFLQQLLVLEPGAHTLQARVQASGGSALSIQMACANGPKLQLALTAREGELFGRFEVPVSCRAQWLRFTLMPVETPTELVLRSVMVR